MRLTEGMRLSVRLECHLSRMSLDITRIPMRQKLPTNRKWFAETGSVMGVAASALPETIMGPE